MAKQYGDEQVLEWRRSYDAPPPALEPSDARSERSDRRYAELEPRAGAADRVPRRHRGRAWCRFGKRSWPRASKAASAL